MDSDSIETETVTVTSMELHKFYGENASLLNSLSKIIKSETSIDDMKKFLDQIEKEKNIIWIPVGDKENNRGIIEMNGDPGKAFIERITNAMDAVLEYEVLKCKDIPNFKTPREAANKLLNIPHNQHLWNIKERIKVADKVKVIVESVYDSNLRNITIIDEGVGVAPDDFSKTILSLNGSNKWKSHYLMGSYGQGGSSTFASGICKYTLIISKSMTCNNIGFTIVKYKDYVEGNKTGNYVYLTIDGKIPTINSDTFTHGTQVTHFGYDLRKYKGNQGSRSLFGLFGRLLFNPIMPIILYENGRPYTIPGDKNLLNNNLQGGRGKLKNSIIHHDQVFANMGEYGEINIEYWVLEKGKENTKPIDRYVDLKHPIIITEYGQCRGEMTESLITKGSRGNKDGAGLSYLENQIIVHVDTDSLTSKVKGDLFISSRESMRQGKILDDIRNQIVKVLSTDDELTRLNNEARDKLCSGASGEDLRKEMLKLLKIKIPNPDKFKDGINSQKTNPTSNPTSKSPVPPVPLVPIESHDPPTYIKIVPENISICIGQSRRIGVETDASIAYCNPMDPTVFQTDPTKQTSLNVIPSSTSIKLKAYTAFNEGRFNFIIECNNAKPGDTGTIRIELRRSGLPTLYSERPYIINEQKSKSDIKNEFTLPLFNVFEVKGIDDPKRALLGWGDDINIAFEYKENPDGSLDIFYSTVYPNYINSLNKVERKNKKPELFMSYYKKWVTYYSISEFIDNKNKSNIDETENGGSGKENSGKEKCRVANMIATQGHVMFEMLEKDDTT